MRISRSLLLRRYRHNAANTLQSNPANNPTKDAFRGVANRVATMPALQRWWPRSELSEQACHIFEEFLNVHPRHLRGPNRISSADCLENVRMLLLDLFHVGDR